MLSELDLPSFDSVFDNYTEVHVSDKQYYVEMELCTILFIWDYFDCMATVLFFSSDLSVCICRYSLFVFVWSMGSSLIQTTNDKDN